MKMFILFGLLLSINVNAQTNRVDSVNHLLERLNNNQLEIDCGCWTGCSIITRSIQARKLYNLDRKESVRLYNLLADSNKGIIAHVILSYIWDYSSSGASVGIDTCSYKGLKFYYKGHSFLAEKDDLYRNKLKWFYFLKSKKVDCSLFPSYNKIYYRNILATSR